VDHKRFWALAEGMIRTNAFPGSLIPLPEPAWVRVTQLPAECLTAPFRSLARIPLARPLRAQRPFRIELPAYPPGVIYVLVIQKTNKNLIPDVTNHAPERLT